MKLLTGITLLIALPSVLIVVTCNSKKWFFGLIGLVLSFALIIGVSTYQSSILVSDSSYVITTVDGKSIYYDESCDKYFILKTNDWNVFDIYYIEYIDTDTATKLIEYSQIVNNLKD